MLRATELAPRPDAEEGIPFSYVALSERDVSACAEVRGAADKVRAALGKNLESILEVGRWLRHARSKLEHGEWLGWLSHEFQLSEWSARRYISVYEKWGGAERARVPDLPLRALYMLAAPETPPEATDEVEKLIESGSVPTTETVREVIAKQKTRRATPEGAPDPPPAGDPVAPAAGQDIDIKAIRERLGGLKTLVQMLEQARKLVRPLLRMYASDPGVLLAAAPLPSVLEDLGDLIVVINRQCWPEGICPACNGDRATAAGECQVCRGGGWANRNIITKMAPKP
jgi:hypothetical protein